MARPEHPDGLRLPPISEVMALAETALVLLAGRPVTHAGLPAFWSHPDVSKIADYATLENLLEAQVVSNEGGDGLAELRVGDARLVAPDVHRQPGDELIISIRAGDVILSLDVPQG